MNDEPRVVLDPIPLDMAVSLRHALRVAIESGFLSQESYRHSVAMKAMVEDRIIGARVIAAA